MVEHFGLKLRKNEEDLRLNRNKYATITDTSRKNTIYEIYNYDSESWNKERMCDVAIYYFKYLEVYLESIMEKEPNNPLLSGKYPKNIEKQKIKIPSGCLGSKGSDRICRLSIYEEKKIECLWCYKNCCGYEKIFDETSLKEVYNNIKGIVYLIKNGVQLKNLFFPEYYGIFCSLMVENDYCFDFDIDDVYNLYNHIKNDLDKQWNNDSELGTYEYCYDTIHFLSCFDDRYENHLPIYNDEQCLKLQERALENFDLNMKYFKKLDQVKFDLEVNNFLNEHVDFEEIFDLTKYKDKIGVYVMVLGQYRQLYVGATKSLKRRIHQHWLANKTLDSLIFGSVSSSKLSIDVFKALDTTRIFVKVYENEEDLDTDEAKLVEKAFSNDFLCNRCGGGGRSEINPMLHAFETAKFRNLND